MQNHKIPYKDLSFFTKFIQDYLEGTIPNEFYNRLPDINNFRSQISEKETQNINRDLLVNVLKTQNKDIQLSSKSKQNIDLLLRHNTFSLTTGHQLCLFLGPLYVIYKIISTIKLSQQLKDKFIDYNFVPIFWMASEDHDSDEVNHINLFGKKYVWETDESGPVGNFRTDSVIQVIDQISGILDSSDEGKYLIDLFRRAYSKNNLTSATRILINELFGRYGILILDPDDPSLKKELSSIIVKDVVDHRLYDIMNNTTNRFSKYYSPQALVRKINFFSLSPGDRSRIVSSIDAKLIKEYPERFSPNVLIRPIYQELLLPNIAYIGGPAEVAYWMQLKDVFKDLNIVFPIVALRDSVLWINNNIMNRLLRLGFSIQDVFKSESVLQKEYLSRNDDFTFLHYLERLDDLFIDINKDLEKNHLDINTQAEYNKHLKLLNKLEKRILKARKIDHKSAIHQIAKIKKILFPNNHLQERTESFISFYLDHGEGFSETLLSNFDPLDSNLLILSS